MDAILFYGERDEATRRQVRSAAASHSHRIGPRKPKAVKQTRPSPSQTRKKNLKSNGSPIGAPATMASINSMTPMVFKHTSTPGYPPVNARNDARRLPNASPSSQSSSSEFTSLSPSMGLDSTDRDIELKRHAAHARWEQMQGVQPTKVIQPTFGSSQSPTSTPSGSKSSQLATHVPAPVPSPWSNGKTERPSSETSMSSSQTGPSSPSSSARLPQYSWTEYPRYGINQVSGSSQSPQQNAIAGKERHRFELPPPPSSVPQPQEITGFRHYGAEQTTTPRSDAEWQAVSRVDPAASTKRREQLPPIDSPHNVAKKSEMVS